MVSSIDMQTRLSRALDDLSDLVNRKKRFGKFEMTTFHLRCKICHEIHLVGSNSYRNEQGEEEIVTYPYICQKCMEKEGGGNEVPIRPGRNPTSGD